MRGVSQVKFAEEADFFDFCALSDHFTLPLAVPWGGVVAICILRMLSLQRAVELGFTREHRARLMEPGMPDLWRRLRMLLLVVVSFPAFLAASAFSPFLLAQETHNHGVPEKLGKVSFPVSCKPAVQEQFDRGVALLHSFAYSAAEEAFKGVAEEDPQCAMAHWGMAMAYFRQLWEPAVLPATISTAQKEILRAQQIGSGSEGERRFINALALVYQDAATVPYRTRALDYEQAMGDLAAENKNDVEAQVFYALALLATASPADKTHANQKKAADVLEPLDRAYPQHPGIPHYLIHAYDNAELAPRGLVAARAYSQIAPSAPHALHMPSHIFTRLGLWDDSIASNLASRDAAHRQGDAGEELHAMDYLVYAYLQRGRDKEAAQVIQQLKNMQLNGGDFKIGYASVAMPVRYAVERGQWADAAAIVAPAGAPPQVAAIAVWARGMGLARSGQAAAAGAEADRLRQLEEQLRASGNDYWATQVQILKREVMAWSGEADGKPEAAAAMMRAAADEEDAIEKLPVTPGPIVPAREQLGYLLLEQHHPAPALKEFNTALANAPGRRGAAQGAAQATELSARK
jgi:tetratricopeptide (TPR) repeat protein